MQQTFCRRSMGLTVGIAENRSPTCSTSNALLTFDLCGQIEILLCDSAVIMRRKHAGDFRIPNVDVGVMIGCVSRLCDPLHESDPIRKRSKRERLYKDIVATRPAGQAAQRTLNFEIGKFPHGTLVGEIVRACMMRQPYTMAC